MSSLLKDNPELDVNWVPRRWVGLHMAAISGEDEVVKLLLAHPAIDVNVNKDDGSTPFSLACQCERIPVVHAAEGSPS